MNICADRTPKPLDVLVEYLYGHKSDVGESILGDIVSMKMLPYDGEEIIEICGRHLNHLPRRTREESCNIAKMQVDRPIEMWITPNVAAYTYAAHAEHREFRDSLNEQVEIYRKSRDWLKAREVKDEHVQFLNSRLHGLHVSLYVKNESLMDSAVSAVAVYDVMTAMEVIPGHKDLFESFMRRLDYLRSVYAVRTGGSPDFVRSEVFAYVFRKARYKQVMVSV